MDAHAISQIARGAAVVAGLVLLVHHWNGQPGGPGGNFFLLAALVMCTGLVLLADPLIDEPGLRGVVKVCGYAGLVGIGVATLF